MDGPPILAEEVLGDPMMMQTWSVEVCRWWDEGFDVLVTPTTPAPAPTLAELTPPADDPKVFAQTIAKHAAFTSAFNVTGHPAISLPLGHSRAGLPIGVQFVANMGREDLLIPLASQLEEAAPWRDRRPPIFA
jgi:amidase